RDFLALEFPEISADTISLADDGLAAVVKVAFDSTAIVIFRFQDGLVARLLPWHNVATAKKVQDGFQIEMDDPSAPRFVFQAKGSAWPPLSKA
ncbi:MAG: hypothetical protein V4692_01270, partial [Bdellovibrionota bacterium]